VRVLCCVSDYPTHYFPLVPLGWALQAAGHELLVCAGPAQAPALERAGLTPVPCGPDVDPVTDARWLAYSLARQGLRAGQLPALNPETGEELTDLDDFDHSGFAARRQKELALIGEARTRAVLDLASEYRPDLVLHDLVAAEAVVAAHLSGVPSVCHLWGLTGTAETTPGLDSLAADVPAPVRKLIDMDPDEPAIRLVLDPTPPPIVPPTGAQRMSVRYVPYNGPGALTEPPRFAASRPRVAVVWGSAIRKINGPKSFVVPELVEALVSRDVDVVLAVGAEEVALLGPLPPNVQVLSQYPLRLLLPHCTAVVHHGGAGSALTAAAAGLPQLVVAFGPMELRSAERIADAGVGVALPGAYVSVDAIREAVGELLDRPELAAAAAEMGRANAELPSPADVVPLLEQLAATGNR
jgi:UDP:flavonoid glycosyltransferase YjiC (YdhE family)